MLFSMVGNIWDSYTHNWDKRYVGMNEPRATTPRNDLRVSKLV